MKMLLMINDLETKRFGVTCAQFDGLGANFPCLHQINDEAKQMKVSMASTRVEVNEIKHVHALEEDGYRMMDTIVYYRAVANRINQELKAGPDVQIVQADKSAQEAVEQIATMAFPDYYGHYHCDPNLENEAASAAYVEWAKTSVEGINDSRLVFVANHHDKMVGFITVTIHSPTRAELVLAAVHPDVHGKGIYNALVAGSVAHLSKNGISSVFTSTQIMNYAVQKAWSRLGFYHYKSLYTFHKWWLENE